MALSMAVDRLIHIEEQLLILTRQHAQARKNLILVGGRAHLKLSGWWLGRASASNFQKGQKMSLKLESLRLSLRLSNSEVRKPLGNPGIHTQATLKISSGGVAKYEARLVWSGNPVRFLAPRLGLPNTKKTESNDNAEAEAETTETTVEPSEKTESRDNTEKTESKDNAEAQTTKKKFLPKPKCKKRSRSVASELPDRLSSSDY